MPPAAFPAFLGRLFIFVITTEKPGTRLAAFGAHQQLTRFADNYIVVLLIDDAIFHRLCRFTDAALTDVAWLLVGNGHGAGPRLGHRPGFNERKTEPLLEDGLMTGIGARAKAEINLPGEVITIGLGKRKQHRHHHTEAVNDCCVFLTCRLPPASRVKSIQLDDAAAAQHHRNKGCRQRVHMIWR